MNCPDIAILTSSHDNIVSDTQHGVDTVRVTRELVTMKTILVLATITLLSISNQGGKVSRRPSKVTFRRLKETNS